MPEFASLPCLYQNFFESLEKDFFIRSIGYDNFYYTIPYRTFRVQQCYTLHVILSGSGTVNLGEVTCRAKENDLFFLPPGQPILYYPDEEAPWQYLWFDMIGTNAEMYGRMMGFSDHTIVISTEKSEGPAELVRRMEQGAVQYYEALSVFYAILAQNRKEEFAEKPESFSGTVLSYLHRHYQNPALSAEEICRAFRISHSYLCKLFLRETGKPMVRHLIEIRIDEACRMLKKTQLSVKEIAYSVGFRDELHFMKTFKRLRGISPKEYRRNEIEKSVQTK